MIEIVGIGPFVVSSLVIRAMEGAGAHRVAGGGAPGDAGCICVVRAGAAMPKAGGTYVFCVKRTVQAVGAGCVVFVRLAKRWCRRRFRGAASIVSQSTLDIVPFTPLQAKADFRRTSHLDSDPAVPADHDDRKNFRFAWIGVVGTMLWADWGGVSISTPRSRLISAGAFDLSWVWFAGWGPQCQHMYSYWGYYNICHLGSEIKDPNGIFRAAFFFRAGSPSCNLAMQTSLLGVGPWREAQNPILSPACLLSACTDRRRRAS